MPGASPLGVAPSRPDRVPLRRPPLGSLFVSPYALFFLVFAFPLGYTVWMSFHRFFFAAPGADVDARGSG